MPSEWEGVDALIRELGAIRAAADASRASETASAASKRHRRRGGGDRRHHQRAAAARKRCRARAPRSGAARELVAALATEIDRARKARGRAVDLGVPLPPGRGRERDPTG